MSTLRDLHAPGRLLILANAWDAGSARVIEDAGAEAIATTSSGVAWARGYPDGNALPTRVLTASIFAHRRSGVPAPSSRLMPTAPAAMTAATVSATARGSSE